MYWTIVLILVISIPYILASVPLLKWIFYKRKMNKYWGLLGCFNVDIKIYWSEKKFESFLYFHIIFHLQQVNQHIFPGIFCWEGIPKKKTEEQMLFILSTCLILVVYSHNMNWRKNPAWNFLKVANCGKKDPEKVSMAAETLCFKICLKKVYKGFI